MHRFYLLLLVLITTGILGQQKRDIKFYNEVKDQTVEIYAENNEPMPISAQLNFKLNNFSSTFENGHIVVIPANTARFFVAKLSQIKNNAANSYSYTYTYNFGNSLQESFDDDHIYSLPYEKGKTQSIFQGYNGKFSHRNEYSLDFDLKMGSPIVAARGGTVVEVVDNFNRNCPDISCSKYNNMILILHSDGTFSNYSHLKLQGATVKKGDVVEQDQLIGYSGNTGFSSGPHLHFAVFINRIDGSRTFIKTKFRTSTKEATLLEQGKTYTKNY